jgi:hypothetical protein
MPLAGSFVIVQDDNEIGLAGAFVAPATTRIAALRERNDAAPGSMHGSSFAHLEIHCKLLCAGVAESRAEPLQHPVATPGFVGQHVKLLIVVRRVLVSDCPLAAIRPAAAFRRVASLHNGQCK